MDSSSPQSVPDRIGEALPGQTVQESAGQGFVLTVTQGPHAGNTFSFNRHDTFLVGRSRRAHFRLPRKDMYFSRIHFLVEVNPPQCRLMDMGSRNGVYVNGARVQLAELKDGDEIRAGRTVLRVAYRPSDSTILYPVQSAPAPPDVPAPVPLAAVESCPACLTALPEPKPPPALCSNCREIADRQSQVVPGYEIVRGLGRGGMGVVSLAVRHMDGTAVALKTIQPVGPTSKRDVERFLREANILRQLAHPCIVAFREMGHSGDFLYIAMEFVRGQDAGKMLTEHGTLPVVRAVRYLCQLLHALQFAHERGFVHRDIKPRNLLVIAQSGGELIKLADFGLAKVFRENKLSGLTLQGDIGGTLPFMPPEQLSDFRTARPAADQFAAGATLYNLLTGKYLHEFSNVLERNLLMVLEGKPVPMLKRRPDLPKALAAAVERATAREPEKRFASVAAFREALLPFAREGIGETLRD